MGEAEMLKGSGQLIIHSVFYFYGEAATVDLCRQITADISAYWNEPRASVRIKKSQFDLYFDIRGFCEPKLPSEAVWYNTNPRFNFFRIEDFSSNHISFVDGIKSNTGYFKLDNLANKSTTAAHEYGHTLGLEHPSLLDIRGAGQPGIMYPRGTICDPCFQYDANARPLDPGGTLNPFTRKVLASDIEDLHLEKLPFNKTGLAIIGGFSSIYHPKHLPDSSQLTGELV